MWNDLWASLVDEPMAQLHGCATHSKAARFSITPALASSSGASKKTERVFMQLARFSQPKTEAPSPTGAPLTIETTKEIGNRSAFSRNETKKETVVRQSGEVLDKERDSVGGALQAIKTGAEFPTGVTVIIQRKLSPRIDLDRHPRPGCAAAGWSPSRPLPKTTGWRRSWPRS